MEQNKYNEDYGYIYLIKPQLFSLSNMDINKAGMSEQNIYLRVNQYGFGSELYTYFYVKNVRKNEKDIIKLLTNDGKNNKNIQKMYGNEYFLMDYKYMLQIIKNVIQNDIIFEMNINQDIQNYKHNKIFVYYDKEMNNEIYDKIKLEVGDYENNYLNRLKYFYNIYAKDVYPDTTDLINTIDFINFSNNIPNKNNLINNNENENKELINTNNDYISQLNKEKELNKIKKYKQRVKYQKESLYICHRCCTYKTIYKSDIKRHIDRKNICKKNNIIIDDALIILSIEKKYFFSMDINVDKLTLENMIYIVNNYNNDLNHINKYYKENNIESENILSLNTLEKNIIEENAIQKNTIEENNNSNSYFYKKDDKFCCKFCNQEFKYKQSVERHILDKVKCEKNQKINNAVIEFSKKINLNKTN